MALATDNSYPKFIHFLSLWITVSTVLLIISAISAHNLVLGNNRLTSSKSAVLAGLILTALSTLSTTLNNTSYLQSFWRSFATIGFKTKKISQLLIVNIALNILAIWILKRFSQVTGFGITSIPVVLAISILISLALFAAERLLENIFKKYV